MRSAIEFLIRSPIDRAVVVPSKASNRLGCKQVGIDNIGSKIRHEPNGRSDRLIVPLQFRAAILVLVHIVPAIKVGDRSDPDYSLGQLPFVVAVNIIVWRTDHASASVAKFRLGALPMKRIAVVVKHDRIVDPQRIGLTIQYRDRLDERQLPCHSRIGLARIVAHAKRL